mgnify:CR=1 FL=1
MDDKVLVEESFSVHLDLNPRISRTHSMFKDRSGGFYGYSSAQDFRS